MSSPAAKRAREKAEEYRRLAAEARTQVREAYFIAMASFCEKKAIEAERNYDPNG